MRANRLEYSLIPSIVRKEYLKRPLEDIVQNPVHTRKPGEEGVPIVYINKNKYVRFGFEKKEGEAELGVCPFGQYEELFDVCGKLSSRL